MPVSVARTKLVASGNRLERIFYDANGEIARYTVHGPSLGNPISICSPYIVNGCIILWPFTVLAAPAPKLIAYLTHHGLPEELAETVYKHLIEDLERRVLNTSVDSFLNDIAGKIAENMDDNFDDIVNMLTSIRETGNLEEKRWKLLAALSTLPLTVARKLALLVGSLESIEMLKELAVVPDV
jgi:hypothetical protein